MSSISRKPPVKKKHSRSLFYRISAWLHLWLGLITGIIMVIVCLMAAIWVFNEEITELTEPETKVAWQDKPVLTPSQLKEIAAARVPGKKASYVTYQQGRAISFNMGEGRRGNTTLRINPYTGEVISVKERKADEVDFFRFVLNGHRFLWLPYKIGRPVVNYSTLIFIITLISGMVLWWPQKWNKSTREKSFKIKWGASFKRVNYDLHNVFGFYSLIIVAAMALTGIVYGIEWYSKGLYWVTSGGKTLPEFKRLQSDSLQANKHYTPEQAMDLAFNKVIALHPEAKGFYYGFADTARPKSTIGITIYPTTGKYYNTRSYSFDQHTLQQLEGNKVFEGSFSEAPFGSKLRRMNYDIHVGAILGLPGKILAFFGALIGASLPITGFLIWWGRKKKNKKGAGATAKKTTTMVKIPG
jgi:uncharacterized iron-regulated membrane protein